MTDVVNHRLPSSRRKRYEKVQRAPAGFVALGDAICSFNPVYGQGMSSAVLQAVALGKALAEHENDARLVHAFYKQAGKVIDNPWKIAVGADFAYPECTGPKPAGTDLVNRYLQPRVRRGPGLARGEQQVDPRAEPARTAHLAHATHIRPQGVPRGTRG